MRTATMMQFSFLKNVNVLLLCLNPCVHHLQTLSCELPDIGPGDRTWVPCKPVKYLSLLSQPSSTEAQNVFLSKQGLAFSVGSDMNLNVGSSCSFLQVLRVHVCHTPVSVGCFLVGNPELPFPFEGKMGVLVLVLLIF